MTIRTMIALGYVVAAGLTALVNGPGPRALAGEIAVLAVFAAEDPVGLLGEAPEPDWEAEDLPAYLTQDEADMTRTELALPASVY